MSLSRLDLKQSDVLKVQKLIISADPKTNALETELEVHERAFLDLLHLGSPQAKLLLLRFCQGLVTREEALIEMRRLANLAIH